MRGKPRAVLRRCTTNCLTGRESFGLKPWRRVCNGRGGGTGSCWQVLIRARAKTDPIPRVLDGKQLGKELDVQATPTIIVNGWKLGHPPSEQELDAMVKAVLAGKEPVSGAGKS